MSIMLNPVKIGDAEYKGKNQFMIHLSSGEGINDMNMYLPTSREDTSRFSMTPLRFVVPKIIGGWSFEELAHWIHTQTAGPWSVSVLGDLKKRPSHSSLLTFFDMKEDATIFKLFNSD